MNASSFFGLVLISLVTDTCDAILIDTVATGDAAQSAKTVPTGATKTAATADPDARTMVVRVTDEAGVPLANSKLHVGIWAVDGGRKYGNRNYTTNADGVATVQRPSRLRILRMWPYKSGYVPLSLISGRARMMTAS
jgi:hypothetical protein